MTAIIGGVCSDGVVLISDRRIVRGPEALEENKIHELKLGENTVGVIAATGLTGMMDKFIENAQTQMVLRRIANFSELESCIEDVVSEIYERYRKRLEEDAEIHALVAGLESINYGRALLCRLHAQGYAEKVKTYVCLGSAQPLMLPFIKILYTQSLNIQDFVKIGTFIILLIQEYELDRNVGGKPAVVYVKHNEGIVRLEESKVDDLVSKIKPALKGLKQKLYEILVS